MTLEGVLREVRRRQKTLVHHAPEPDDLADQLDARNVDVRFHRIPPDGPAPFVTVYEGGEFRAGVTVATLRAFFHPDVRAPGRLDALTDAERALYELLDGTVFGSLNRRQLLATSREIEARAWRTGHGELHAGFQSWPAFDAQRSLYRRFGTDTDLDVHVYLTPAPTATEPADAPVTVHENRRREVGAYWFLAFDGGGTDRYSALVAEQHEENAFRGAWTYDPGLVSVALAGTDDLRVR